MLKRSSNNFAPAMTLVEVMTAMTLMGVLLVGIVTANARHMRQLALAERRLKAVAALEALISTWDPGQMPRTGEGPLGDDLAWRITAIHSPQLEPLGGETLRIEVHDPSSPRSDAALIVLELAGALPAQTKDPAP